MVTALPAFVGAWGLMHTCRSAWRHTTVAVARTPSVAVRARCRRLTITASTGQQAPPAANAITDHPANNVPETIAAKIGRNLHREPNHPLNIIKTKIEEYFVQRAAQSGGPEFTIFDDYSPIVGTKENFDDLLIPPEHVSRKATDTYYVDDKTVLRTHTSAHQSELIRRGLNGFLLCGDVYRRDEIDRSHYPVFHQLEGVRIFSDTEVPPDAADEEKWAIVEPDLKANLEGMARHLFGDVQMRWVDAYFPFTHPSAELEIFFNDDWMEVLGCGVIQKGVMANAGRPEQTGWAFGLGLERLAMVLFSIPDIRLFWSQDERFSSQFKAGQITTFQPYSKYPMVYKDISFWLPTDQTGEGEGPVFHENDFYELVRGIAGDLVEEIKLLDKFTHPKTKRDSLCYRVIYRSMDRSLTNEEIDQLQEKVREDTASSFSAELR